MANNIHRIKFFENQVHQEVWKNSMAGKNEERCLEVLSCLGYKLGEDFVRQHPLGERFVADFAFLKEQVVIEIDGDSHNDKKQRLKDKKRDRYLYSIDWIPLRVKDRNLFGEKALFWKYLIQEVVEERRKQYQEGNLHKIEIRYIDEDYD